MPCSAITSGPRSLVFVAGAFPDRPMALTTAPNVKAAAVPQITPIKMPRATSPLHHSTPTLTSTDTTKNTTVDNITLPASLARILHPIVSANAASVRRPTLFAAERLTVIDRSAAMSLFKPTLGRRLAQLVLLLLWEVGGDDLEIVLLELVDHPVGRGGPAGEREQRRGTWRHLIAHLLYEIVVYPHVRQR